jgi:ArsR family transcriptional regulator, arsenate/arsenite/antimonite-responsive transcriptional repressor
VSPNSSVMPMVPSQSSDGAGRVTFNSQTLKDLVEFFKVLSDETRLKILQYLAHSQELHVRALCELLKQSQPAVSHHLALLRMVGLIECRRDGKHNYYHLVPSRFREVQETLTGSKPALALWSKLFAG